MQRYELTFLTRNEGEETRVADLIVALGGRIESQLPPVRRKLVYPIEKETSAVYHTVVFELETTAAKDLLAKLESDTVILRSLLIAGGLRKAAEAPSKAHHEDEEVSEALERGMKELAEVEAKAQTQQPVAEEVVAAPTPAAEETEETAESLTAEDRQKKLDEKLKSILGDK